MTNIIKHKRSDAPGSVPDANVLSPGELAVNTADGKLFTRKSDGTVVDLTSPVSVDGGEITYDSLLEGLSAFWLMDRTVGSVPDESGNGRTLFIPAAAEKESPSVQNDGLLLDRRNFLYADHAFGDRRSVSFWVKLKSEPAEPSKFIVFGPFGDNGEASGSSSSSAAAQPPAPVPSSVGYVEVGSDRKIRWSERTSQSAVVSSATPLDADRWTHVALVRETSQVGQSTAKIYVNGVLSGTATGLSDTLVSEESDVMTLGLFNEVAVGLDCVGLWDRALSAEEVSVLFGPEDAYSLPPMAITPIDPSAFINVSSSAPVSSLAISVAGSSGALTPSFDDDIHDYVVLTNSAAAGTPVSYTLNVNGSATQGSGTVNALIKISHGSTSYYIRLLPSDMPIGTITTQPGEGYIPGYYIATSRRDININNYNIVYSEHGIPLWYVSNPGTPHLAQHGNDRNKIGVSRNGVGARYSMEITSDSIEARQLNFLPTVRNGNTYSYNFGNHEFLEVGSPPEFRGNIIYNTFVAAPAGGSQAVTDKAYGVYVQEQAPDGSIAWEWWTSDRFDQTALARNASFFHMNSVDIHPVTGDMLMSCRQCSAVICVDRSTKDVKWVIQGASQPWGGINQTANQHTLDNAKWLSLEGEPELEGYQYLGPEGQHQARWAVNVDPLFAGNDVISVFDNQSGFFPGSTNSPKTVTSLIKSGTTVTGIASSHGFATGSYVKVSGANEAVFNGVFQVTVVNSSSFTYSVSESGSLTATGSITATRALTYWPHSDNSPAARGVVYEIDLANNKAIHRGSAFAPNGTSGYLGSYQIMLHDGGSFSHVLNFTQQHPQLVEYGDEGDGASPGPVIYAVDFPGDIYRITKVEKDFFNADYLRATAGLAPTIN